MSLDTNYADEREAERKKLLGKAQVAEQAIKGEYKKPEAQTVLIDILARLDSEYDTAFQQASDAVDNDSWSSSYLQRAFAYDTIRAYIKDKLT